MAVRYIVALLLLFIIFFRFRLFRFETDRFGHGARAGGSVHAPGALYALSPMRCMFLFILSPRARAAAGEPSAASIKG